MTRRTIRTTDVAAAIVATVLIVAGLAGVIGLVVGIWAWAL